MLTGRVALLCKGGSYGKVDEESPENIGFCEHRAEQNEHPIDYPESEGRRDGAGTENDLLAG